MGSALEASSRVSEGAEDADGEAAVAARSGAVAACSVDVGPAEDVGLAEDGRVCASAAAEAVGVTLAVSAALAALAGAAVIGVALEAAARGTADDGARPLTQSVHLNGFFDFTTASVIRGVWHGY